MHRIYTKKIRNLEKIIRKQRRKYQPNYYCVNKTLCLCLICLIYFKKAVSLNSIFNKNLIINYNDTIFITISDKYVYNNNLSK